jgi:hypothetical protein
VTRFEYFQASSQPCPDFVFVVGDRPLREIDRVEVRRHLHDEIVNLRDVVAELVVPRAEAL